MASKTTSPQDQYFEALRSGQEALNTAIDDWAKSVKEAWASRPDAAFASFPAVNPSEIVDQVFEFAAEALQAQRRLVEFAAEILENQRQLAKNVAETSAKNTAGGTA
jgi:hypothetical protein